MPEHPPPRATAVERVGSWALAGLTLLLTLAVAILPPLTIAASRWVPHLEPLPHLAVFAALFALALARASVSDGLAHPLAAVGGVVAVMAYFAALPSTGTPLARAFWLLGRVGGTLAGMVGGQARGDPLVFALLLALVAWLFGHLTAWAVYRHRSAWWAIVPNAVILLANLQFAPARLLVAVPAFFFAALLLLARLNSERRSQWWAHHGVRFSAGLGWQVLGSSTLASALVLGVAWAAPVGDPINRVERALYEAGGEWAALQALVDRVVNIRAGADSADRPISFGEALAPRGSFELAETPLLRVQAAEARYWRAATYDRYTGRGMVASEVGPTELAPGDEVPPEDGGGPRDPLEQRVQVLAAGLNNVVAADRAERVDRTVLVDLLSGGDLQGMRFASPLGRGEEYAVVSLVSHASAEELRAAGDAYPARLRRYLQLPRRLPGRLRTLAARITAGAATPYDAARAIESYLRGLTYSTQVPVPPPDRDWVDFTLFDSRAGYCDTFATAMVVLLRLEGIPARVASGFATGDYDAATGTFLVRERHAHSWPEVYFPGYGWQAFEPSAIRPPLPRGHVPAPLSTPGSAPTPEAEAAAPPVDADLRALLDGVTEAVDGIGAAPGGPLLLGAALLSLAGLAARLLATALWRRSLRGMDEGARLYTSLCRLARLGNLAPRPWQTPFEYAAHLERALPSMREQVWVIAETYVEGAYGPRPPRPEQVARATAAWRALRRALLRRAVVGQLSRSVAHWRRPVVASGPDEPGPPGSPGQGSEGPDHHPVPRSRCGRGLPNSKERA